MRVKKSDLWGGICAFTCLALVVLFIALLATTVNREVGQKEMVVPWDTYQMKFYGTKEQGKYTTGVGVRFLSFKRNLKNLKVGKITCLSNDKIEMTLNVKLQMLLMKDSLKKVILKRFGGPDRHTDFIRMMSRSSIISTCLNYTAVEYYSDRSGVDAAMLYNLQREINDEDFGATIEFFQLETISLPEELVSVITEKQNIEQDLVTAVNDRENHIISATTELLEAEQVAKVTLIEANNTAKILRNKAERSESIILNEWSNRAIAYSSVVSGLGLNDSEFLEYLNSELLRQASRVIV
jgi:regulator of protease activity HflC (stomatin/prohibitin superfamily)